MDVRNVLTGERLSNEHFMNMYVVRVQPERAIAEPDYFIKMIEVCESNRNEEIRRIEAGVEDVHENKPMVTADSQNELTEWEKI